MLHFHSGWDIDEGAATEYGRIQRAEFVVANRNDFAEPRAENFRIILEPFSRTHKDHTLFADSLLDVGVDCLAVELSLDAGQEFSFLLGNAESLEGAFNVVWYFFPGALRFGAPGEIITDLIEVDGLEFLACPVRGERFLPECLQSAQTKIAHPIRVLLHIGDVVDRALAQARARVAHVSFRVKEIALTAIDIDGCRFGFHLLLPRKHWFGSSLACPIVTSLLELQSEFFSPTPHNSPSHHHMDVVGNDVVQEPLIVRN